MPGHSRLTGVFYCPPFSLFFYGVAIACFFLISQNPCFAQNATAESSSSATTSSSTLPTTTTSPPAKEDETLTEITNTDVMGCKWPSDYATRVNFCLQKTNLTTFSELTDTLVAKYGILDIKYIKSLANNCLLHSKCGSEYDTKQVQKFVEYWSNNMDSLVPFESCLRQNTEGMVKLCGPSTQVGKVVSGAAGLHLNLLGIFLRMHHESDQCLSKTIEAVHFTAAIYLYRDVYQMNTVLCWNSSKVDCTSECAKFASELFCLSSACSKVPSQTMASFGIWEWYFGSKGVINARCNVNEDVCKASTEPHLFGKNTTFTEKVKQKWNELTERVETVFHVPMHVVLSIFLASLLAFVAISIVGCMWYHGTLCQQDEHRKLRYSSLLHGNRPEEMRSLANADDDDD